jgi:hypothetical protein
MIKIKKSQTADTRTCDYTKVSKEQLLASTVSHIEDVRKGLEFMARALVEAGSRHDHTKLTKMESFHRDFLTGLKSTDWWEMHKREERHHLVGNETIPEDVNLIDVIECIVDGVMAGMARSGSYTYMPIPAEILETAVKNTAKLLLSNIEISSQ